MVHCLFHRDNDGRCSGAIVGKRYGVENVNFIPINYGEVPPWDEINEGDEVIIVDFSLQGEGEWDKLLSITDNIIWIDHHKTAIENEDYPHHVNGLREDGVAGAQLTWNYFFPLTETPEIVRYVSDYDVWKFEMEHTRAVSQGLYLKRCKPQDELWQILLKDDDRAKALLVNEIIKEGYTIIEYNQKSWKGIVRHQGYYTRFESYKAIVCNLRGPSLIFESIDRDTYEIMVWWWFNGKGYEYRVSTHRDDIDVSAICKKHGGGGHKKMGGFQRPELLESLTQESSLLADEAKRIIKSKEADDV